MLKNQDKIVFQKIFKKYISNRFFFVIELSAYTSTRIYSALVQNYNFGKLVLDSCKRSSRHS